MSKEICTVCGREIDSRGMSGHMRTHKGKSDKVLYGHEGEDNGVISYPSQDKSTHPEGDESTDEIGAQGKPVKKSVKKPVASKPASSPPSSPPSKPDTRGQRNSGSKSTGHPKDSGVTEANAGSKNTAHPKDSGAHKKEWQGFFRD